MRTYLPGKTKNSPVFVALFLFLVALVDQFQLRRLANPINPNLASINA